MAPSEGKPRKRFKFGRRSHTDSTAPGNEHKKKPHFTLWSQIHDTIFNSWINLLLVFVPVGIALRYAHINPVAIFIVNFIAIIPLAAMLSYATEEIALRVGETLGGLLNATFGNAVELIVSILALKQKEVVIVKTSLIGSILSNLLLVMGMCFFFGGLNRHEQFFNVNVAQTAASLLALSAASLIVPTAFRLTLGGSLTGSSGSGATPQGPNHPVTQLSRATAVILLLVYGAYLLFQLKSHASMYNERSKKATKRNEPKDTSKATAGIAAGLAGTMGGENVTDIHIEQKRNVADEEEREDPRLSLWTAIITLTVSTVFVALCAEFMVSSIDAITSSGHISKTFVGLILLPIVGNAAEHATAVTVAIKDKMDLAIGVAVGSSMQIALLILPLVVILGWILKIDEMTLDFDAFQISVLFVSVYLINSLISDGKSHW